MLETDIATIDKHIFTFCDLTVVILEIYLKRTIQIRFPFFETSLKKWNHLSLAEATFEIGK